MRADALKNAKWKVVKGTSNRKIVGKEGQGKEGSPAHHVRDSRVEGHNSEGEKREAARENRENSRPGRYDLRWKNGTHAYGFLPVVPPLTHGLASKALRKTKSLGVRCIAKGKLPGSPVFEGRRSPVVQEFTLQLSCPQIL